VNFWRVAVWNQFGAAVDTLENALTLCPDHLWNGLLVSIPADAEVPPEIEAFWYVAYHTIFWLDLYCTGSVERFAPPPPFTLDELDPAGIVPHPAYTQAELLTYLHYTRAKCRQVVTALTDERAQENCTFPWMHGRSIGFLELLLYSLRHVQEHAAQLHLYLGQNGVNAAGAWVGQAADPATNP